MKTGITAHFSPDSVKKGLTLGLVVAISGLILASTPFGRWLEEDIGLHWLFKIRGTQPAPPEVVVVSIDQASSSKLQLSTKPRKWPRILHAHLVRKLSQHGVRAIGFDIIFDEPREPMHNQKFAEELKRANNVILFQYLRQENITIRDANNPDRGEIHIEKLILPVKVLKENAFGLAPFPLPKVPAKVNHFLMYKPSLGNAPTMPVVLLQTYALPVYDDLYELLKTYIPGQLEKLPDSRQQLVSQGEIHIVARQLRRLFRNNRKLAGQLLSKIKSEPEKYDADKQQLLTTLIRCYQSPYSRYLNFYGPAHSIKTIPYHEVLFNKDLDLKNKVVLVGFSEQFQPEQKDGFYTVFSEDKSGLDISGVEIIATAFANLLTDQALKSSNPWLDIFILIVWAILLGIGLRLLPGPTQIPAAMGLAFIYSISVYLAFSRQANWLPLAVPVLWQIPLATLATLFWRYLDVQRERRNIRQAFGYHLPANVVDQLAAGVNHVTDAGQQVHGIVLATDAQQYTTLSENMDPEQLRTLMNLYYETLFTPIRKHDGVVSDVVGDAALAIWASSKHDIAKRNEACLAALDILAAVDNFNASLPDTSLPTRMGLHYGEIVMGHVGAVDHYEYRAVGDIVNTATRIESLNKHLGTRILVSDAVLESLENFHTRKLGTFLLAGKHKPVTVHELLGLKTSQFVAGDTIFEEAIDYFQQGNWQQASDRFEQCLQQNRNDGPANYYLQLCQSYREKPPNDWDGIIRLVEK